jgi:hypothetical protein
LAKQPLWGFCLHRPALALLGGIASRLLAQPALRAEPVFSSLGRGDSWDASRQIAQPVACPISHPHNTCPRNWRSLMGLHGASAGSFPHQSLTRFRRSPRTLCLVWGLLVSGPGHAELLQPSRDVPSPGPIPLAAAWRSRADVLSPRNLCRFGSYPHAVAGAVRQLPAQRGNVMSCHFDSSASRMIPEDVM